MTAPTPETPAELAALIRSFGYTTWSQSQEIAAAITDRLATLAASSTAPVIGWMRLHPNGDPSGEYLSDAVIEDVRRRSGQWVPLVRQHAAAPAAAERKPLTHMQIVLLWGHRSDGPSNQEILSFGRAIERAHGIGITAAPAGSEGE